MMDVLVDYLGRPASLLTVILFAASVYGLLWWWTRPQDWATNGFLEWAREPIPHQPATAPAETAVEPDHVHTGWCNHGSCEEPPEEPAETQTATPPAQYTERTFRLGTDEISLTFADTPQRGHQAPRRERARKGSVA